MLRSVGRTIPTYTKSLADSPVTVAAPGGALWEPSETVDLDFAAAVALPGMFGLSGDLAGLPDEALERLAEHVAFFKRWRTVIRESVAHLLTPPCPKEDRRGWAAVQLEHPPSGDHLLFAYRLDDGSSTKTFRLRNLDPSADYQVVAHAPPDATEQAANRHPAHERGPPHRPAATIPRGSLCHDQALRSQRWGISRTTLRAKIGVLEPDAQIDAAAE